jgi:tetratricopeptide (TPR) repeat protein
LQKRTPFPAVWEAAPLQTLPTCFICSRTWHVRGVTTPRNPHFEVRQLGYTANRLDMMRFLKVHCLVFSALFLPLLLTTCSLAQGQSVSASDEERAVDLYRSGNCAGAVDPLARGSGRTLLLAGQCYLIMHDGKKAQVVLDKYHAAAPDDTRGIVLLARADCAAANCQSAITLVKIALEKHADDPTLTSALASIDAQIGQAQAASELWQRLLISNPGDPGALTGLGMIALTGSNTKRATELFERAIAAAPDHAAAHAALGRIALEQGDSAKAITELELAYSQDPVDRAVTRDLVTAYLQSQKWDAVLSTIEGIPYGLGNSDDLTALYSTAALHLNDPAHAEKYYQAVIRQNPNSLLSRFLLSDLLYDAGNYGEANTGYQQAIAASASASGLDSNLRIHLGRAQFRTNNMSGGRSTLEPVLAKDRENKEVMLLLAQIAARQNRWDEARTYSNLLLLNDPKNTVLLHIMAEAAMSENLDAEAAGYLEQLFQIDPKDDAMRMKLVVLYSNHKNLGQLPRAFGLMNDAVAAHPDDPQAMLLLANLYRKDDQMDKARELFMKGFEKLPGNVPATYSWAFNSFGLLLFS